MTNNKRFYIQVGESKIRINDYELQDIQFLDSKLEDGVNITEMVMAVKLIGTVSHKMEVKCDE